MARPDVGVLPSDPHFIKRNGGWFRPAAQGYTTRIIEAGVFSGEVARAYRRECDGISIKPITDARAELASEIEQMRRALVEAERILAHLLPTALIAAEDQAPAIPAQAAGGGDA